MAYAVLQRHWPLRIKKGLDLVEIAPTAKPPVCRVMDYSKFKFEKNKKDREARKKQRQNQVDTKEVKFRPKIDEHDYEVKMKKRKKVPRKR